MNVLEVAGSGLKKVGTALGKLEYAGPCPSCGGTDRFRVWPEKREGEGSYWCRRCGKGGDLVQFFVDFEGMDFKDAFRAAGREPLKGQASAFYYRRAAEKACAGEMIKGAEMAGQRFRNFDPPVETWLIKARALVDWAHKRLLENGEELGRLADRGIGINEVKSFRLGWFPGENGKNCAFRPRESWGLNTEFKEDGKKKKMWIPRGLVIPMIGPEGVERIRIRRPDCDIRSEKDIRYYTLPGSSMAPMVIRPERKAFVVIESDLDGIMVAGHAGAVVGVVSLGAAAVKPDAETFAMLRGAVRTLVALDSDSAGAKAVKWWEEQLENTKRWPVPEGKDPGEAFKAGVDILEWVMSGLPPALTLQYESCVKEKPKAKTSESVTPREQKEQKPFGVLDEVKQLLDSYPVKINVETCVPKLIYTDRFTDEAAKKRLHQLVCFNSIVLDYLYQHHAVMIHRGNFDNTIQRMDRQEPENREGDDIIDRIPGWSDEQIEHYGQLYRDTENRDSRIE